MSKTQRQRTAVVTGGRRGIGAAIVGELESNGVRVLAPLRTELDLADTRDIDKYLKYLGEQNTQIDILVNNAGINNVAPFTDISLESWLTTLQVNLNAPFRLAQSLAPPMQERAWGRIVNISSVFGIITRQNRAAYTAAKSALAGLTRTLAVETGRDNVLVNAVAPGYVETELTRQNNTDEELSRIAAAIPLGRLAQPCEIAKLVRFLCSDDNTYITGQVLIADGGITCI